MNHSESSAEDPAVGPAVGPAVDRVLRPEKNPAAGPAARTTDHAAIRELRSRPWPARYVGYTRMSGPGWLQGAITLGGGSLAGALFLGLIAGPGLLWLQPLAMACGVITLGAIAYVTLVTGRRPFGLINQAVSPALGWAWLIATIMANVVWCMPQFNLAVAALQQNLLPAPTAAAVSGTAGTAAIGAVLFAIGFSVNVLYNRGASGVRWVERLLQLAVGLIVLAFMGVVIALFARGDIDLKAAAVGLIPDPRGLFNPSETYRELIAATGPFADYWRDHIVSLQRDRIIAAFGTAVGINMTFLLPYTLLKKGWGKERRELAIFDLAIGLLIPFILATTCIVLASSAAFHGKTADVLTPEGTVRAEMAGPFAKVLDGRLLDQSPALAHDPGALAAARNAAPAADRELAAMLANRDNFNLAATLTPLVGPAAGQLVFGLGVLGMAISTLIVLMMMNGFAFRELLHQPESGGAYLLGAAVAGAAGFAGPFLWGNGAARAALAIPTSVIGGSLLPIACFTFLLLINSRRVLGDAAPRGTARLAVNLLLGTATAITTFGSVWVLTHKGGWGRIGLTLLAVLALLGTVGFIRRERRPA